MAEFRRPCLDSVAWTAILALAVIGLAALAAALIEPRRIPVWEGNAATDNATKRIDDLGIVTSCLDVMEPAVATEAAP